MDIVKSDQLRIILKLIQHDRLNAGTVRNRK